MGRLERWEEARQLAKGRLARLEENIRAKYPDLHPWHSAPGAEGERARFLSIQALGGVIPFLAVLRGLHAEPLNRPSCWKVWIEDSRVEKNGLYSTARYSVYLWERRRKRVGEHDAELFEGFTGPAASRSMYRTARPGRRGVLVRGTIEGCMDHCKLLFTSWDAAERLGGRP